MNDNPRAIVREWINKQIEGQPELRAPDIADLAIQELGVNTPLMAALGVSTLRSVVYEMVLDGVQSRRGCAIFKPFGPPQSTDTPEQLQARLADVAARFADWMEHAGNRHVAILKMTREEVKLAIDERKGRIASELVRLSVLEHLYANMRDGQKVGDVFTPEQLAAIVEAQRLGAIVSVNGRKPAKV